MYHMVTGSPPFDAMSSMQVMMSKLQQLPQSPQQLNQKVSLGSSKLNFTLMAVKADKRPQDCAVVRRLILKQRDGNSKKKIHLSGESRRRLLSKNIDEKEFQKKAFQMAKKISKHYAWIAVAVMVLISLVIVDF